MQQGLYNEKKMTLSFHFLKYMYLALVYMFSTFENLVSNYDLGRSLSQFPECGCMKVPISSECFIIFISHEMFLLKGSVSLLDRAPGKGVKHHSTGPCYLTFPSSCCVILHKYMELRYVTSYITCVFGTMVSQISLRSTWY